MVFADGDRIMSRNRRRTERKQAGMSSKRPGGNRWCRLHVECLEGRLLLSGNSLLGALENAPTALLSTLGSVTGLLQPTPTPTDSQTGNATGEPSSAAQLGSSTTQTGSSAQSNDSSASGLGLSLNLAGLASVQIGTATAAAGSDASQHASAPGLLNLSLGSSSAVNTNTGIEKTDSGEPGGIGLPLGVTISSGVSVGSSTSGAAQAFMLRVAMDAEFSDALFGIPDSTSGAPPVEPSHDSTVDFHVDIISNVFTVNNVNQFAQALGQTAAKDARQANDPHSIDPAGTSVTGRGSDMDNGTLQAATPTPLVGTSQVPANPTSAATSVTNAAEQQLSLVARAAAAVMPAALRLATDSIIEQSTNTDPDAATNAPADDADSPSESSVMTVQAAAKLVPTGLLAIAPGDLRAVDQALERLLDEIDSLGGGLVDYAASSDMLQWATAGAGLAACVGGAYFHRKRRSGTGQSLEEESASWMFLRMQSLAAGGD